MNESVQIVRAVFDRCRKNIDRMETGLQFVESYFTENNFPGWHWNIYTRGTLQNKTYFEIEGTSPVPNMNCIKYSKISLKYNCCNKTGPVLIIKNIIPEMNAWSLEGNDKQAYRNEMDPIFQSFEGMMFKNPDPFIPQIAKILTDIKKMEDVNNGALQLKSLLKQIQLKKDF